LFILASIIDQRTRLLNIFDLSDGYRIACTGIKVFIHDGSQLHSIGILPGIYMEKTIKGVKEGRDEFLEKAVEAAIY
jgi:C-terminal processing protease CtpA/Prc